MLRIVALILFISFLTACGQSQEAPTQVLPRFTSKAGQFEKGRYFRAFMEEQENGQIVEIDASLEGFDGDAAAEGAWFILWAECEGLDVGENPSTMKCTGTQFTIAGKQTQASGIFVAAGEARLKGSFEIKGWTGPNQGLMSCILIPR